MFTSDTGCIVIIFYYTPPEILQNNETVLDTINVSTLRPNKPAIKTEETKFLPLAHPICKTQVNYLVDFYNAFDLFQLFFPDKQIQISVDNTNKNAKKACKRQGAYSRGPDWEGREIIRWIDTNVKKLYAFFDIYIYESMHPKSHLADYWQVNEDENHS